MAEHTVCRNATERPFCHGSLVRLGGISLLLHTVQSALFGVAGCAVARPV